MENNRLLAVYTARSRKEAVLQAAPMDVAVLFARLSGSQVLPMTHDAYMGLKKAQQDDLKDVGAYIAGKLKDGRRRSGCVLSRSAAVLDADNLPPGGTEDFIRRVAALGVCCCVHSTAKHSPVTPRLRAVIPFAQDIPAEQYAPVVRLLCRMIQPELTWFDPSCDRAGQIMYNPTHCQDVEPVCFIQDKPLLDAGALLERDLPSWRDPRSWPQFPRAVTPAKLAAKQEDPTAKTGVVGAFCRAYDVPAAMAKFLPGVYEETATEGRYTFTGGSTWGGAVLYDSGKFLFSHHATDPCCGRLVNSFDLVRLHRFGELDDVATGGNRGNTLPSWTAMVELARSDDAVKNELAREALSEVKIDFQDEAAALELAHYEKEPLDLNVLRSALRTMGTQVRRNLLNGKLEIVNMPPKYSEESAANILPVLLWDMLKPLKIKGNNIAAIQKGLAALADENRYNPVLDMLHTTPWDGEDRFQRLLEILNVDGDSFYALLLRKWLIQCVALVHNTYRNQEAAEGVLVLQGPEGIGKTTLFRKLAIKSEWLAEGITLDMKNKDSILRATGVWIAELGELDSTLKKEQSSLKAFITQTVDKIRAPYAAEGEDRPRRTSFGATVNPLQFLKDDNGDRRFFVIPVSELDTEALLALEPPWFVQLWAQVYTWWWEAPNGFRLSRVEREHLNNLNQQHREMLPAEEETRLALDWNLPREEWGQFTATDLKRQLFLMEPRITPQQIGRVLAKLEREELAITYTQNSHSKVKAYTLPLKKTFSVIADTPDTAETLS